MATISTQQFGWFRRLCYNNNSKYYDMKYFATLSGDETTHSDNSITYSNLKVTIRRESQDFGYLTTCPGEDGRCVAGCCTSMEVYGNSTVNGTSWRQVGSYSTWKYWSSANLGTVSMSGSITLAPGESTRIAVAKAVACTSKTIYASFSNPNTRPSPRPPSLSPSCYASTANGNTIVFNGGGSWGYCETGSNRSSYEVYDNSAMTNPIKSGSGYSVTVSGLSPNTRYWASFYKDNGCYSRSATCSAVTVTPNTLSDAKATKFDEATVRLAVTNGGGEYDPNTTIWLKPCVGGSWKQVASSSTKSVEVINLTGLEPETCYQVQARTTTPAGTYTGNTVTFNTPKKGLCVANYTQIDVTLDERTYDVCASLCYKWETTKVPAKIRLYYRVKDGYDDRWYYVDAPDATELTGQHCVEVCDLYPNQTVYETYIHTETDEAVYDSDMWEFVTPVIPEPDIHNCETFTYLTELLCESIMALYEGNKTIYANDCAKEACDPDSLDPTLLTLWSRALRYFHALYCLLCDMGGSRFTASKPGQYLVGEAGWQDIITEIDENATSENWKLATSDAIKRYILAKLHEVWHYHNAVDYLVATPDDLANLPETATSAIVASESKIYRKVDGEWIVSTAEDDQVDSMGVWHINNESSTKDGDRNYYVQAGAAWYYWNGNWQPMDANVVAFAKIIDAMWEKKDQAAVNEPGKDRLHIDVKDKDDYDCLDYPADERWLTVITEPTKVAPPGYHLLTFETGKNATIVQDQEVLDGALPQKPTDPEKTCMDFVSWNDKKTGTAFDWTQPVKKDYNLVAVWSPHPVVITFDIGDGATGTAPEVINGFCGDRIGTLVSTGFSKPGGTFLHWAIDGVPIDENYVLERDSTAVAVWKMEEYNVTFVLGNGEANVVKVVEYGDSAVAPAAPSREDWIFTGWYNDSAFTSPWDSSTQIKANTTVYAGWIPAAYTITFNPNGGTDVPSQKVAYEEYATRPDDPTRDGYILKEWQLDGEPYNFDVPVTKDITLDAVWDKVWIVTFDTDGGSEAPEKQIVRDGQMANLVPDPTKDDCVFGGWYDASGEVPACPKIAYTVTFDLSTAPAWYSGKVATPDPQEIDPDGYATDPDIDWCIDGTEYGDFLGWQEPSNPGQYWNFAMMKVGRNITLQPVFDNPTTMYNCGALPEPD